MAKGDYDMQLKGHPFRRVVSSCFVQGKYSKPGHGRRIWNLECGHHRSERQRTPVPAKARCHQCPKE